MSARSIGNLIGGNYGRRKSRGDADAPTDPVRSHSYDVDDPRARPGRPIGDRSEGYFWALREAILHALKIQLRTQDRKSLPSEHRIQHTYLEVMEAMFTALDRKTGDFFISHAEIARRARVAPSTVKSAVKTLEHWGFIAHVRRSRVKEGAEGRAGPQREQACNAYYLDCRRLMPPDLWDVFYKRLTVNLGRIGSAAKRRAENIYRTFNEKARPAPYPSAKSELQQALDRLGAQIQAREAEKLGVSASP